MSPESTMTMERQQPTVVSSSDLLGVNEQTIKDFIEEQKVKALTVEWVLWALRIISDANMRNARINPEWLRAAGRIITARGIDDEPTMIYA